MVRLESIYKDFNKLPILHDISIDIVMNKLTCLVGPSGCGKTTIMNMIGGLVKPDRGIINGIGERRFTYVFQEPRLIPWKSVVDNILFVMPGFDKKVEREIAMRYLSMVGLTDCAGMLPDQLSGGMKKRAAIARAFSFEADLMLMDEPFESLDVERKKDLIGEFRKIFREEPRTVLLITHDIGDALSLADTVYVLSDKPTRVLKKLDVSAGSGDGLTGADRDALEREIRESFSINL